MSVDVQAARRTRLLLVGRSSIDCLCVQVRLPGRYKLIWPPLRFTKLWRRVTG